MDPNNPRNAALVEALRAGEAVAHAGARFRLEADDDLLLAPSVRMASVAPAGPLCVAAAQPFGFGWLRDALAYLNQLGMCINEGRLLLHFCCICSFRWSLGGGFCSRFFPERRNMVHDLMRKLSRFSNRAREQILQPALHCVLGLEVQRARNFQQGGRRAASAGVLVLRARASRLGWDVAVCLLSAHTCNRRPTTRSTLHKLPPTTPASQHFANVNMPTRLRTHALAARPGLHLLDFTTRLRVNNYASALCSREWAALSTVRASG